MVARGKVSDTPGLTIQEVSSLSGLSEPILRYYERIGLFNAVDRDESSGHRRCGMRLRPPRCGAVSGQATNRPRRRHHSRS